MTSAKRQKDRQSKSTGEVHVSGIPSREYRYRDIRFRTVGSAKEMAVDGSVTPVDFFIQPPSDELWYIEYITLLILDPGVMAANVFGSLVAALSTGLEIIEKIKSVESIYTTIEDNADLAQCFFGGSTSSSPVGPTDAGFLDTVDRAVGRMPFHGIVSLDGADSDQFIARVNDDLLLVQSLMISAHVRIER